jgi:hypothetical protein
MQKYYEQYILPVLSNQKVSPKLKSLYKRVYKHMADNKGAPTLKKKNRALCQKSILSAVQRRVARDVLSGVPTKKVVLITDSYCYSACIWTAKILISMPNCVLVGKSLS